MLGVTHLRKTFGPVIAVEDVSFGLERGQLVGLLGPNGAGKTTTVSMIAGLLTPDRGDVLIGGARPAGRAPAARAAPRRRAPGRRHRPEEAPHRPGAAGPRALRRDVGARQPAILRRALRAERRR